MRVPDSLRAKTRIAASGRGHRLKRFVVWDDKAGAACTRCNVYIKIDMSNPLVPPAASEACKDFVPPKSTFEVPDAAQANTIRQVIAWLRPGETIVVNHTSPCGLNERGFCPFRNRLMGHASRHGGGKEYTVRHIRSNAIAITCIDATLPVITLLEEMR